MCVYAGHWLLHVCMYVCTSRLQVIDIEPPSEMRHTGAMLGFQSSQAKPARVSCCSLTFALYGKRSCSNSQLIRICAALRCDAALSQNVHAPADPLRYHYGCYSIPLVHRNQVIPKRWARLPPLRPSTHCEQDIPMVSFIPFLLSQFLLFRSPSKSGLEQCERGEETKKKHGRRCSIVALCESEAG